MNASTQLVIALCVIATPYILGYSLCFIEEIIKLVTGRKL